MDTENEDYKIDNSPDAQRDVIRRSLDAIANDVAMALRDAGLNFPVFLAVPNSRNPGNGCDAARPFGCRLAAGVGNRLSDSGKESWL